MANLLNGYQSSHAVYVCFSPPSEPGGPKLVDWTKVDHDVFTTNGSVPGWCNVDPAAAYAGKMKFKEECDCKYDGLWGRFCEVSVESVCINQCSGHGHCHGGFCQVILLFINVAFIFCLLEDNLCNQLLFSYVAVIGIGGVVVNKAYSIRENILNIFIIINLKNP